MSNEKVTYCIPYSSAESSYGLQATADAGAAPNRQSQRYDQQRLSGGGANYNWFGNSLGHMDMIQRAANSVSNTSLDGQKQTKDFE